MPGVRIQHATQRNVLVTLAHAKRPYVQPVVCSRCVTTHVFKTYHLDLDESGAVIVSREIVEALKAAGQIHPGAFSIANEVGEPPDQRLVVPSVSLMARPIQPTRLKPVVAQE